jgi:predicted nuclease of restriction endonuclease-like (RecB) superfamily
VNVRLINLYWEIGQSIAEKQNENCGKAIVPKLSEELQAEFPGIGGFSTTNLWLMAQFYTEYHTDTNLQPLVGEISWSKHIVILNKCKQSEERQFYTMATKKFGWTKDVLTNQIENKTFTKYLINQTNFDQTISDKGGQTLATNEINICKYANRLLHLYRFFNPIDFFTNILNYVTNISSKPNRHFRKNSSGKFN